MVWNKTMPTIFTKFGAACRLVFSASICLAVIVTAKTAIPAASTASCISGKCHKDVGAKRYIHGPIGSGSCEVCHPVVAWVESKHPAIQTRTDAERCLFCHAEAEHLTNQKYVHTPVKRRECIACHDPHQSDNLFLLKISSSSSMKKSSDLCFTCHDRTRAYWNTGFHGAVALLECNVCHDPHGSPHPYQLTRYVKAVYLRDYLSLGEEDLKKKNYSSALDNLSLVLVVEPKEPTALALSAKAFLGLNKPEEASPLVDKILENNPLDAEALFLKGMITLSQGQNFTAISLFQQSISLKPGVPEVWLQLGLVQLKNNLLREALSSLTKAAELSPSEVRVHQALIEVHKGLGHQTEQEQEELLIKKLSVKPTVP